MKCKICNHKMMGSICLIHGTSKQQQTYLDIIKPPRKYKISKKGAK